MIIIDSALKFGTMLLSIVKKMSLKDGLLAVLILATVSFAWASNDYRNDAIDARADYAKYKIEIQEKGYDDQLDALKVDKEKLNKKVEKLNKEKQVHIKKSKEWKKKFDDLMKNKPNKKQIKDKVGALNGVEEVCDELSKLGIDCFIFSTDPK